MIEEKSMFNALLLMTREQLISFAEKEGIVSVGRSEQWNTDNSIRGEIMLHYTYQKGMP
jgi:hypothetical protein